MSPAFQKKLQGTAIHANVPNPVRPEFRYGYCCCLTCDLVKRLQQQGNGHSARHSAERAVFRGAWAALVFSAADIAVKPGAKQGLKSSNAWTTSYMYAVGPLVTISSAVQHHSRQQCCGMPSDSSLWGGGGGVPVSKSCKLS